LVLAVPGALEFGGGGQVAGRFAILGCCSKKNGNFGRVPGG